MEKRCTYSAELNNHSALVEHAATRCGKLATYRYGGEANASELYLFAEHAEHIRKTDKWGETSVVPL